MAKPQLLSGARGQIKISNANGTKVLAYVTDCSIDIAHQVRPIHTFGSPAARSVEPSQVGPCTIRLGRVIPVNDSTGNAVASDTISQGIEPTIQTMLTADDITIDLFDRISQRNYASVRNCRFTGRNLTMSASQIANETITLMGIYDAGSVTDGAANNTANIGIG